MRAINHWLFLEIAGRNALATAQTIVLAAELDTALASAFAFALTLGKSLGNLDREDMTLPDRDGGGFSGTNAHDTLSLDTNVASIRVLGRGGRHVVLLMMSCR